MASTNYYDQIALGYDRLHRGEQRGKFRKFVTLSGCKLGPTSMLLDVGCGSGVACEFYKSPVVFGIDPSGGLLERSPAHVVKGGGEALPYKDSLFELVISVTALQNFTDPILGLEEMLRVGQSKFVITILKRGKDTEKLQRVRDHIAKRFVIDKEIDDQHDFIYVLTRKN
eukprot:CAMPEP_0168517826 /NCGR_PEP_ID=MMETSP0405-20121227/6308_1 /TAXON_ID=498012 /ORGANISM="Trichosphaerium sp, Strain Am-I-7 wt" /LENGTH=169 /DNA_ID=CAMNT_0008537961 /DNA_START=17 /DNA_END=526 /DNA_ORIENTATION=+